MSNDKKDAEKPKVELSPEEEAAKAKKKKLLIFAIGGAGLLIGVGAGLFFFLSAGSSKKAQAAPPGEHGAAHEGEAEGGHGGEPAGEHGGEHGDKKADAAHGEKKAEGGHGEAKGHDDKGGKKDAKDAHGGGHEGGDKKADGGKDAHGGGGKKDEKGGADAKLEGVDFGCTVPLIPFHLNLGNPLENRYIRLEISLEYGCAEEQKAEINKRLPQLRDAIIAVTSRKTREFLLGPDGKEQLRKEIHNRVNHYMTKKIDDVYITDILIE